MIWVYFCVKQLSMPCPRYYGTGLVHHLYVIFSSTISPYRFTLHDADERWSGIPVLNYCIVVSFSCRSRHRCRCRCCGRCSFSFFPLSRWFFLFYLLSTSIYPSHFTRSPYILCIFNADETWAYNVHDL